jgi:hypothetical protein
MKNGPLICPNVRENATLFASGKALRLGQRYKAVHGCHDQRGEGICFDD